MIAQTKEAELATKESKPGLSINEDILKELDAKSEQKSFDNHLLDDLLKVISLIKNPDFKTSSFPSLSKRFEKFANSEVALKELKSINNITDLLKLSKKYDLGLEKISVKKLDLETLKNEFPVLAKKEFFTLPKAEHNIIEKKNLLEPKKEPEIKPTLLTINSIEKPTQEIKKEPTLLEKIMDSSKEIKKEPVLAQDKVSDKIVENKKEPTLFEKIMSSSKDEKKEHVVQDKTNSKIVDNKKEHVTHVVQDKTNSKIVDNKKEHVAHVVQDKINSKIVENKKEHVAHVVQDKTNSKIVDNKKEHVAHVVQDKTNSKIVENKKEHVAHVVQDKTNSKIVENKKIPTLLEKIMSGSKEEIKTAQIVQKEASKIVTKEEHQEIKSKALKDELHAKIDNETKTPKHTMTDEKKIEPHVAKKGMIESILKNIKTDKSAQSFKTTLIQENLKTDIKTDENSETKTETTQNRVDLKSQIKIDTLASKQLNPMKDTLNSFAADFKEKLENYKPPFMKMQLALNPKGLGEVDVVILNRGKNLHVNISSNTNTMMVFTQNQMEFKNSLINMGFTNLDMNFSDQKENKEQHQNSRTSKEFDEDLEDENIEEETTSIELVVPQYI
ncbi:MAG: flagellar hook-length control protein FliK [Sulfurospirillum sp.]|nr:flagellar hook-length control protein FliK [Sulfurospirillum sp.]